MVRMRSAVQICLAAPRFSLETVRFLGIFLFLLVLALREKDIQKDIRPQNIEYFTTKKRLEICPGFWLLSAISRRFQGLPEDVPSPLHAFFIGMGVHPQSDSLVTVAQLLTDAGHVRAVGYDY